jgi:hypothetical protein
MNRLFSFLSEWITRSGDTTFWSYVITAAYAIVIALSVYYVATLKDKDLRDAKFLWICLLIFLVIMGINKQLDFQILATMIGRSVAEDSGFYDNRRLVQKIFTIGALLATFGLGGIILFRTRKILRNSIMELTGAAILLFFAFVRVGSINHLNKAITFEQERVSHIHGLELLGLAVIFIALVRKVKRG